jgi:hypothetical protein
MKKNMILFLLLLLMIIPGYGHSSMSMVIKNFDHEVYGAHKQNWGMVQDNRGIMYFANSEGVLEFDSLNWRLITLPGGSGAYGLAKDHRGRVYVGGDSEIGYLAVDEKGIMNYRSLLEKVPVKYRGRKERIIQVGIIPEGVVFLFERLLLIINEDKVKAFEARKYFFSFIYHRGELYLIDDARGLLMVDGDRLVSVTGGHLLRAYVMLPFKNDTVLIITTQCGGIIFDPAVLRSGKDAFRPLIKEENDYFQGNLISCGLVLENNHVVLGSLEKGIAIFNPDGGQVSRILPAQGLKDRHVYGIYRDTVGNIWVGMDNGISMIRIPPPFFRASITPPRAAKGTFSGSIPFAALIRGCQKFSDESVIFGGAFFAGGDRVQDVEQPEFQVPEFEYAYNGFRFTFSSNNYVEIEKTNYQCYLEGSDKDWSNWFDHNTREYTNLHWGKYRFRVRARNHLGEISREASFTFRVKPPWYETWWFLAVQIGFIISVLATSGIIERLGWSSKISNYGIIFAVIIIFEYVNGFIGPIIGRYSDGIAFFGMLMTGVMSIIISPVQDFIQEILTRIFRGRYNS